MRWGGVIILLFVVYHILDLTTGTVNPDGVPGRGLRQRGRRLRPRWYVTLVYTLAVVALGFHLRHGIWSALQTLGRTSGPTSARYKAVALVLAVVLIAGFLSVPVRRPRGLVS